MDQPVVRASPAHPALHRRLGKGEVGAVILGAAVVLRHQAAGGLKLAGIVGGEVGADDLPTVALVVGAEDMVAGGIERIWVVRREHDGEGPLEAILSPICRYTADP